MLDKAKKKVDVKCYTSVQSQANKSGLIYSQVQTHVQAACEPHDLKTDFSSFDHVQTANT